MKTSEFWYELPAERIAQVPQEPRDHSRLLVLDRKTGSWEHTHFFHIGDYLRPGDLLVMNDSRVFKARLRVKGGEIFLLRPENTYWLALGKPGRKFHVGGTISIDQHTSCTIIEKRSDGTLLLDFHQPIENIFAVAEQIGEVPTPPYVKEASSAEAYQTIYAKNTGSVAAPTAGFHFTPTLIQQLTQQGIQTAFVTLHVGLGTFRRIKTETLEAHEMHSEWIHVPQETRQAIQETRKHGGRIIVVGTTTVRALESGVDDGFTNIFITPGYHFKTIDGLITNFHLPQSTLLVLVSAFVGEKSTNPDDGRKKILDAYQDAIQQEYRFYSFGDAMLII